MSDIMKPTAFIFAMLLAATASAESLTEWRTPDGKTYFGDHPPPGSTAVKTVDKEIGTVETQPVAPAERGSVAAPKAVWRTGISCQDLTLTGVKEEVFDGISRRIVRGTVTHDGSHLVRDVRVCGGDVCDVVRGGGPLAKGESALFSLDMNTTDPVSLRIECSVREPAA
jgi:Domain of unknown function (DUF4124)